MTAAGPAGPLSYPQCLIPHGTFAYGGLNPLGRCIWGFQFSAKQSMKRLDGFKEQPPLSIGV
jgi:hypothetical protein